MGHAEMERMDPDASLFLESLVVVVLPHWLPMASTVLFLVIGSLVFTNPDGARMRYSPYLRRF